MEGVHAVVEFLEWAARGRVKAVFVSFLPADFGRGMVGLAQMLGGAKAVSWSGDGLSSRES